MKPQNLHWAVILIFSGLVVACGGSAGPALTPEPNPVEQAAAEATALVQQAQATALVLQARVQATALVEQALRAGDTPTPAVVEAVEHSSPTPAVARERMEATSVMEAAATAEVQLESGVSADAATRIRITNVSFAAEGGMIIVRFQAPPEEAEKWWPGTVSVTDEGSGVVYNEIPVMPKIGPLIGRPKREGQAGYVMLTNVPPYLQRGALVTVVLGTYTFEHVPVQ